jgi:hypothetical protein
LSAHGSADVVAVDDCLSEAAPCEFKSLEFQLAVTQDALPRKSPSSA